MSLRDFQIIHKINNCPADPKSPYNQISPAKTIFLTKTKNLASEILLITTKICPRQKKYSNGKIA